MSKSSRQLFQPESPVFWALNTLLHLSEVEIKERFRMTTGQLKSLKQGKLTDSLVAKRIRRFLLQRVDEYQGTRCRNKWISQYRLSFVSCLSSVVGLTMPRRTSKQRKLNAYNRVEDAVNYLTELLKDNPLPKGVVRQYTTREGFDWRMTRKAAAQMGVRVERKKWRLP